MGLMPGVLQNTVLISAFIAWVVAQLLKVIINTFLLRDSDWRILFSSGGFPSSHTASVTALSMGVGKYYGWHSPIFALAAVFAIIVMYDAAGVRRAAGKQAERINQIIESYYQGSDIAQERLKELIGHTPFEVFGGVVVGILVGLIV